MHIISIFLQRYCYKNLHLKFTQNYSTMSIYIFNVNDFFDGKGEGKTMSNHHTVDLHKQYFIQKMPIF